jgi:arylsulfatase A-like enzyme
LENTLVVMTGDNGMPFPRSKANLYDSGVRMPMAVRWGGKVEGGRKVGEFVSLTDLAPTFLEVAGVEVPGVMTGRSIMHLLLGEGGTGAGRDFVVFGRERHTPAQELPSVEGYPSRGIRTGRWLLILNLEPGRWPAGVAAGGTHPMDRFADCDDGPTKRVVMGMEGSEDYRLCFGRRPAVELYDCEADPDQVRNVAGEEKHAGVVKELSGRLRRYLEVTGDPRFAGGEVEFDMYRYRTGYLKARLEGRGYELPWE